MDVSIAQEEDGQVDDIRLVRNAKHRTSLGQYLQEFMKMPNLPMIELKLTWYEIGETIAR